MGRSEWQKSRLEATVSVGLDVSVNVDLNGDGDLNERTSFVARRRRRPRQGSRQRRRLRGKNAARPARPPLERRTRCRIVWPPVATPGGVRLATGFLTRVPDLVTPFAPRGKTIRLSSN
jgi:hypothetical protein